MKNGFLILLAIALLATAGCTSTGVKRVDADTQLDLSGYWNDVDVRLVCETLIRDCLSSPRVDQAIRAKRGTPKVIVGRFRNDSSEQIDTTIISSRMEMAIFNSGKLDFVAGGDTREELRMERDAQQSQASEASMRRLRNETGADFMLTGSVKTIVDREGNQTVRTYFVSAELTDIETTQRVWIGQNDSIKKVVTRAKNKL